MTFRHAIDWQFQRVDGEGDGYIVDALIRYDIEPLIPGKLFGPPEDCYPAEGGYVDDLAAFKPGTDEPIAMTGEERKELVDWIELNHDHAADRYGDPDAAYDAWRDERR